MKKSMTIFQRIYGGSTLRNNVEALLEIKRAVPNRRL
jgi:hypothetical protein